MNTNDKILKYLSGLMNSEEKAAFERQLGENNSLKNEFEKTKEHLSQLTGFAKVEGDERYFNSVVPRMREKLETRNKKYFPRLSFAAAAVAVLLLISVLHIPRFVSTSGNNGYLTTDFSTLISSVDSSSLEELFENNYVHEYTVLYDSAFRESVNDFSNFVSFDIDEFDYTADIYYGGTAAELLNDMTDEEIEAVYQSLLERKNL